MNHQEMLKSFLAVEAMKSYNVVSPIMLSNPISVLKRMTRDKGWSNQAIVEMGRRKMLGKFLGSYVLRNVSGDEIYQKFPVLDYLGEVSLFSKPADCVTYRGTPEQNQVIDRALAVSPVNTSNNFFGSGIAGRLSTFYNVINLDIGNTPIAIIGGGAAGQIVRYGLSRTGFKNVTLYEKGKPFGIWSREDIKGGSRNNPRRLVLGEYALEPAPGEGSEVRDFLQNIQNANSLNVITNDVTTVTPNNLAHGVYDRGQSFKEYPIVINCLGLGKPKNLSDRHRMVTSAEVTHAGNRWQKRLTYPQIKGKKFLFIGLGNSTAEMLRQLHDAQDRGIDTDYSVLTHYPKDSVFNPDDYIIQKNTKYRVFRDLSASNLVDYEGDLPQNRADYYRALRTGRIVSDVTGWDRIIKDFVIRRGRSQTETKVDEFYNLTGYENRPDDLVNFGCSFRHNEMQYDYDGEIQKSPGLADPELRLHKGYFGFGALLGTSHNPNAIVIPGMLHRLGDLLFGVIVRSMEYKEKQND